MHPDYCIPDNLDNDIAILNLQKSLLMNDLITPIELPSAFPQFNGTCMISGYGQSLSGIVELYTYELYTVKL